MEWTRGPTIGRGASATVSIAAATSGELFAVKSAELSRSTFLQREQHFLSQLSSPHIVQYLGFEITCESNKPMYNLFMEYVPAGTLSDELKRQGGSFTEPTIRSYTHQILQGLDYLHLNGLVHCDIKGQNVLMGKDGLKIADLGCARLAEDGGVSAFSGTPVFMAPEVACGKEQGFPADVWALGCTVIEMATGSNPWPEVNDPVSALYRIGFSGDLPEFPSWLSEKAKDFLSKCLRRDSKERWTAKQLLQHPFLDDPELNYEKLAGFGKNSPTTVLDHGFWDSLDVWEAPRNLTHIGSSSNSPAERIKHLIGGDSSSDSNLPNWTWDEDWITIRNNSSPTCIEFNYKTEHNEVNTFNDLTSSENIVSNSVIEFCALNNNDIEESKKFLEQSKNMDPEDKELIDTESNMFFGVNLEDYWDSFVYEDLLPEWSVETISIIECLSVCIDFVTICETVTDWSEDSHLTEKLNGSFVLVQFEVFFLSFHLSFVLFSLGLPYCSSVNDSFIIIIYLFNDYF